MKGNLTVSHYLSMKEKAFHFDITQNFVKRKIFIALAIIYVININ